MRIPNRQAQNHARLGAFRSAAPASASNAGYGHYSGVLSQNSTSPQSVVFAASSPAASKNLAVDRTASNSGINSYLSKTRAKPSCGSLAKAMLTTIDMPPNSRAPIVASMVMVAQFRRHIISKMSGVANAREIFSNGRLAAKGALKDQWNNRHCYSPDCEAIPCFHGHAWPIHFQRP